MKTTSLDAPCSELSGRSNPQFVTDQPRFDGILGMTFVNYAWMGVRAPSDSHECA